MKLDFGEEKLAMGVWTGLIMAGAWVASGRWPSLQPTFTTLTGGLVSVYAIFSGGSLTSAWLKGKIGASAGADTDPGQDQK